MHCSNCHAAIHTERTGFVVCPHCGHVNIVSGAPVLQTYIARAAMIPEQTLPLPRSDAWPQPQSVAMSPLQPQPVATPYLPVREQTRLRRSARRALLSFAASLVVGIIAIAVAQNVVARSRVADAVSLNASGHYAEASAVLSDVPSLLVLPSIRSSEQDAQALTHQWLAYLADEATARDLINSEQYDEALQILHKIPTSYPSYQTVKSAIQFADSALAASAKTAEQPRAQCQPTDCSGDGA